MTAAEKRENKLQIIYLWIEKVWIIKVENKTQFQNSHLSGEHPFSLNHVPESE